MRLRIAGPQGLPIAATVRYTARSRSVKNVASIRLYDTQRVPSLLVDAGSSRDRQG
jgi:hypothetical protein